MNNLQISEGVIHIWYDQFSFFTPKDINIFASYLSDFENKKADRFINLDKKNKFIISRGLLRSIISFYLNTTPKEIGIEQKNLSKPHLKEDPQYLPLRFSLSHSKDLIIYAFNLYNKIGIDIEAIREIPYSFKIAKRFFSKKDNLDLLSSGDNDSNFKFLYYWTRKEAVLKATGAGLSHLYKRNTLNPHYDWLITSIDLDPNYVISLAQTKDNPTIIRNFRNYWACG